MAKSDKSWRMVIYRKELINKIIPDKHPIRRSDDVFDDLRQSKYFTETDLKDAYTIVIHEDDIFKTTFSTSDCQSLRTLFGEQNAPAKFCRLMFMVIGNLN